MGIIKFLKKNIKKELIILFFICLFIVWSFILYKITPSQIVNYIGINNSYVIIIILGFLGGTSILFPFPYYLFVFSFAAGGSNPLILGICAGIGVAVGESTSYLVGYQGRSILSKSHQKKLNYLCKNCDKPKNTILISLILFLYGAFIPLPNDIMILPLGAARYNYWKLIIPLGLGNIIFNIILAYSGIYGWHFFFN